MSNEDNFEAAIIFSRIAAVDIDGKYKNITLDFLDLLNLIGVLTRSKLSSQLELKVLYKEQWWIDVNMQFDK